MLPNEAQDAFVRELIGSLAIQHRPNAALNVCMTIQSYFAGEQSFSAKQDLGPIVARIDLVAPSHEERNFLLVLVHDRAFDVLRKKVDSAYLKRVAPAA